MLDFRLLALNINREKFIQQCSDRRLGILRAATSLFASRE